MKSPFLSLAAALMALSVAGAGGAAEIGRTASYDYDPPEPGTYTLPIVKSAADGKVLDSAGRSRRLVELTRGRITVLSFIYTRCAEAKACPYATGVLNQLHRFSQEDSSLTKNLRLVSMSFDPANDTPERMAAYSAWAGGRTNAAEWSFITTVSQQNLRPILEAYGQAVDKKRNAADPTGPLNHTLRVFLIDREGRIRNIYSSGTLDPRLVLADVRTLMIESSTDPNRLPPAEAKPGSLETDHTSPNPLQK
jgi:protein SCO1